LTFVGALSSVVAGSLSLGLEAFCSLPPVADEAGGLVTVEGVLTGIIGGTLVLLKRCVTSVSSKIASVAAITNITVSTLIDRSFRRCLIRCLEDLIIDE